MAIDTVKDGVHVTIPVLEAWRDTIEACSEMTEEQWEIFDEATQRRPFFREPEK